MSHGINSRRITEEKWPKNQHDFSYYSFGVSADTHLDYLELAGDWVLFAAAGALIPIVAYKLAKPAKAARKR
jgi:hypothetical protein